MGTLSRVIPTKHQPRAGFRVGKLVVIQRVHDKKTKTANLKIQVRVECDCGQRLTIPFWYMVRPHSPPKADCGKCGPKSLRTLHPSEHTVWYMMNYRCKVETAPMYKDYGGRGIKVCERWSWDNESGFENFLADMPPRPEGLSIDRIKNMGHYEPGNCRWATALEQRHNQGREGPLEPNPTI